MRALYFGTYERDYPRNAQVISSMRAAGVDVVEHHVSVWDTQRHKWSLGLAAGVSVLRAELELLLSRKPPFDVVVVGYPGHVDVPTARRIADGRPVVFNPLVSLYDTLVDDRGRYGRNTLRGRIVHRLDAIAFHRATVVVADTEQQARFFAETFGIPPERLAVCLVGAEDRLFTPGRHPPAGGFHALFVGKLIPLHGLETILEAARLAPEIPFRVIGSGQLDAVLRDRPDNVEWVDWVEYELLPAEYRTAGCALGIFGTSDKALRVIPNKAFQAIACGTPLVTGDTPAARGLLTDGVDALLVPPSDPQTLADAISRLATDTALRERIGAAGRATYEARASEEVLGAAWRDILEAAIERR